MRDKVVLVTGATAGIGRATAAAIARQGATVIVAGRDEARARRVVDTIRQETGNRHVDFLLADLSSIEETWNLAERLQASYARLDVLVNNVGGIFMQRGETRDGIENTWALNYLVGRWLVTHRLLDVLRDSAPARIVNVSSAAHLYGRIDWADIEKRHQYSGWLAYGQAKLADVVFTYELARRLRGTSVAANVLHPGVVATNFMRTNNRASFGLRLMRRLTDLFSIGPEEGAETSVYLATSGEVAGVTGSYLTKKRPKKSARAAFDEAARERLWALSVEMLDRHWPAALRGNAWQPELETRPG